MVATSRDEVIKVMKSDAAKNLFGTLSDAAIEACFRLCDYEGYGEDIEFASYMAATILNRLRSGIEPEEIYAAWRGGDSHYTALYFEHLFSRRTIRDYVYEAMGIALNAKIKGDTSYNEAWSCHGICIENGYYGGVQRSQDVLKSSKTGEPLFKFFSTGI